VVALAFIEGLIIEGFFLLAMMVALRDSVWYWSNDIAVAAVFHPAVETYLDIG
jgi:hypothetical protein